MYSFLDYCHGELRRGYELENDEQRYIERRRKFHTFLWVPIEFEKFTYRAYVQIVDSFLFVFTLLPIRFLLSCWFLVSRSLKKLISKILLHQRHPRFSADAQSHRYLSILQPAEMCDLLKGLIMICATLLIFQIDIHIVYHEVKSQSVIKLYIFFNMLEVLDKLMSVFSCDVLDALFWTATEPVKQEDRTKHRMNIIFHLCGSIVCVIIHSFIFLLQATTLNVALNSKNDSLKVIMMSNNFVELKGMVFKKFEKNNLFYMSCSDVRERFHFLVLMLLGIIDTLEAHSWKVELYNSDTMKTWRDSEFLMLLVSVALILIIEAFVDWFKHAFVTRFNEISSQVYQEYTITLAYDVISSKLKKAHADHSDLISRRMGFIPISLAVLVYRRLVAVSLNIDCWRGCLCLALGYLVLLASKSLFNMVMMGWAVDEIERHRAHESAEKAKSITRQCASMPSSRHASTDNVPDLMFSSQGHAKSQPQTPRSSLTDITSQAQAMQENLDQSFIFSDSTVSLTSLKVRHKSNVDPSSLVQDDVTRFSKINN